MGRLQGALAVVAGALTYGAVVGFSIMQGLLIAPVCAEFGWSLPSFSLHISLTSTAIAFVQAPAARLFQRFELRNVLAFSVTLSCCVQLLAVLADSLAAWYALALVRGVAIGLVIYLPLPVIARSCSPRRSGLALGLMTAGSSITGMLVSPLFQTWTDLFGWRVAQAALGAISLCVAPLVLAFLKGIRPKDPEQRLRRSAASAAASLRRSLPAACLCFAGASLAIMSAINQQASLIARSAGFDAMQSATCLSALMAGGIAGKILLGAVNDRFGTLACSAFCFGCGASGLVSLFLLQASFPGFLAAWAACGIGYAGLSVVPALMTQWSFGPERFDAVMPSVGAFCSVGDTAAPLFFSLFREATGTYYGATFILAGMLLACLLLAAGPLRRKAAHRAQEEREQP
ncbi:MFS transporter [Rubneribacter sp.]